MLNNFDGLYYDHIGWYYIFGFNEKYGTNK